VRQVPQLSRSPLGTCQQKWGVTPFFGGGADWGHACHQVGALSVRRTGEVGFVWGFVVLFSWLVVFFHFLFCFLAVKSSKARFSWVLAGILISSSLAGVDLWPTI